MSYSVRSGGGGGGGARRGGGGGARGGPPGRGQGGGGRGGPPGRGRGGGRGGGRDGGGRGGRDGGRGRGGGGGRGPSQIASNVTSALSNLILADVTPNFKFYLYGVDCTDKNGKLIDSRRRRMELFGRGLYDEKVGLLTRLGHNKKEVDDLRRIVFFEGSTFYSARRIPGLDQPRTLVGERRTDEADAVGEVPVSDNGDSLRVTMCQCLTAPVQLTGAKTAQAAATSPGAATVVADRRCSDCTKSFTDIEALFGHCQVTGHSPVMEGGDGGEQPTPANRELFLSYCNVALQRAMGERMARWGRDYIDPKSFTEPKDRNGQSLGVRVFQAYTCEIGLNRPTVDSKSQMSLTLTCDLKAKVLRTRSLLDMIYEGYSPADPYDFSQQESRKFKQTWCREVVICTYDKRCYSVIDLDFDNSPASVPVADLGMSHAEYFEKKKGIKLKYPNAKPIVQVLGRNQSKIFLPAELVCSNELEPRLKMQLPMIASFKPPERHRAIEEMKRFLQPGAQKTKGVGGGLLPALGITLKDERFKVPVECLPLPQIVAAGMRVPDKSGNMWAPIISQANFKVNPQHAVQLKVVVVYHDRFIGDKSASQTYNRIRDNVNNMNAKYRFGENAHAYVAAGDMERHWGAVESYFSGSIPSNLFVLDLCKPKGRAALDPAYSVVKSMLSKAGHLSQFVNFNTYDHGNPRDFRKSSTILQGVGRQILSKCGVRVWWVSIPKSLPLPAVFVGVDVYHAPRKYDPVQNKRIAKASVAAVIVQVLRDSPDKCPTVEIYSHTAKREAGQEMELGSVINEAVSNALTYMKVSPMSCIVWRDGVGDAAVNQVASQEIPQLRLALSSPGGPVGSGTVTKASGTQVPLAYVVVQKRISTKFLSMDGSQALPAGALVTALQGPEHATFYINGTSPPYSTPKPARFVIAQRDQGLHGCSLSQLSWALCHDYPNWTGPIKLPAPVQCAHKLAELAGNFNDCGESINAKAFTNKIYFL